MTTTAVNNEYRYTIIIYLRQTQGPLKQTARKNKPAYLAKSTAFTLNQRENVGLCQQAIHTKFEQNAAVMK